jgi:hypothetical protein
MTRVQRPRIREARECASARRPRRVRNQRQSSRRIGVELSCRKAGGLPDQEISFLKNVLEEVMRLGGHPSLQREPLGQ